MFKFMPAFTLLALFGFPATAQCTGQSYLDRLTDAQQSDLSATVENMPYANGLIWQAVKDNAVITVVGTMHIYDPRLSAIRSRLAGTVENADLLMLEATAKEEMQIQSMVTTDPGRFFIIDGPTLPELVDESTWASISKAASQRGIPVFVAAKMQPWYLSLLLAVPPCAMVDMTSGLQGLDHMIADDARTAGVPQQAVEPYTTLFDLFGSDSIDEQIEMLRLGLMAPDLQEPMFVAMLDLYFNQDIGRLWEVTRIATAEIPGIEQSQAMAMFNDMQTMLLDQRNQNWIPVITQASQTHDNIVLAVGASHLIGTQGILQLLENEGWSLTRLDYASP